MTYKIGKDTVQPDKDESDMNSGEGYRQFLRKSTKDEKLITQKIKTIFRYGILCVLESYVKYIHFV